MLGNSDVLFNETYVSGQKPLYAAFNTKLQNIINIMENLNYQLIVILLASAYYEDHKLVSDNIEKDIHKKFGWEVILFTLVASD